MDQLYRIAPTASVLDTGLRNLRMTNVAAFNKTKGEPKVQCYDGILAQDRRIKPTRQQWKTQEKKRSFLRKESSGKFVIRAFNPDGVDTPYLALSFVLMWSLPRAGSEHYGSPVPIDWLGTEGPQGTHPSIVPTVSSNDELIRYFRQEQNLGPRGLKKFGASNNAYVPQNNYENTYKGHVLKRNLFDTPGVTKSQIKGYFRGVNNYLRIRKRIPPNPSSSPRLANGPIGISVFSEPFSKNRSATDSTLHRSRAPPL